MTEIQVGSLARVSVPADPDKDINYECKNEHWTTGVKELDGKIIFVKGIQDIFGRVAEPRMVGSDISWYLPLRWLAPVVPTSSPLFRTGDRAGVKKDYWSGQLAAAGSPWMKMRDALRGKVIEIALEGSSVVAANVRGPDGGKWVFLLEDLEPVAHDEPLTFVAPTDEMHSIPGRESHEERAHDAETELAAIRIDRDNWRNKARELECDRDKERALAREAHKRINKLVNDKDDAIEFIQKERNDALLERDRALGERDEAIKNRDGALRDRLPFAEAYANVIVLERDRAIKERDRALDAAERDPARDDIKRLHNYLARETPHPLSRAGAVDDAIEWLGLLFLERKVAETERAKVTVPSPSLLKRLGACLETDMEMVVAFLIMVVGMLLVSGIFLVETTTIKLADLLRGVRDRVRGDWEKTRVIPLTILGAVALYASVMVAVRVRYTAINAELEALSINIPAPPSPDDPREKAWIEVVRRKREVDASKKPRWR